MNTDPTPSDTGHQTPRPQPHPWGQPYPPDHPAYRPPPGLQMAAIARWLIYVTVLGLATIVVTLAADSSGQGQGPSTSVTLGHSVDEDSGASTGDRFTSDDQSRYYGPTAALPSAEDLEEVGR